MTLEQQVVSLDLAKKLKELGVKQESLFYWQNTHAINDEWHLLYKSGNSSYEETLDHISAFTVAELGELLNFHLSIQKGDKYWYVRYWWGADPDILRHQRETEWNETSDDNLANALAKMLIYLIENKLI